MVDEKVLDEAAGDLSADEPKRRRNVVGRKAGAAAPAPQDSWEGHRPGAKYQDAGSPFPVIGSPAQFVGGGASLPVQMKYAD